MIVMVATERPRPVYCVNEHEHRDRALADAVAAGRFTFGGETRELGLEPDWLGAELPEDEEWRIDWVKFYYGLDLADAYRSTGDARYLQAWEQLVVELRGAGPARPRRQRGHGAPDPQLDLRLAAAAGGGRRRGARAGREPARPGRARAREPLPGAQPPDAGAVRAADRLARAGDRRPAARGAAREPAGRLRTGRRAPRALHALPLHRAAVVRRRARELPPLRGGAPARLRRAARARVRVRARLPAPRRHHPRALGQRHRRLHRAAAARRATARPRGPAGERGRRLPRRRLLRPAHRRPLPDLRLRPVGRRRPRALRRAEPRGVGGRPAAGGRPGPLLLRRGRPELAPLVPRHPGPQHRDRGRRRPDAVRALALLAAECRRDVPRPRRRHPRRRGALPVLRRRPPPQGHARRRPLLGDRGRAGGRAQPPLRPALAPPARPGRGARGRRPHAGRRDRRSAVPARSRSRRVGSAPSTASSTPRRS